MINLDGVIIGAISVGILDLVLVLAATVAVFRRSSELRQLKSAKPAERSRRKKWRRQFERTTKKRQRSVKLAFLLLAVGCLASGAGSYAKYYQMTNLTALDTENIVTGHYLIDQLTDQLSQLADGNDEKATANIQTLAMGMASFTAKKGSDRGTKEAQLLLNRYYTRVGQLGINLSVQKASSLKAEQALLADYLTELERVGESQTKVLDFFQVDKNSLAPKQ